MRSNTIVLLALLSIVVLSASVGFTTNSEGAAPTQGTARSNDNDRYSFAVGSRLGDGLARGCSIFVGHVSSVSSASVPNARQGTPVDNTEVFFIVTEWLWNKPQNSGDALRLQRFPSRWVTPWESPASPDRKNINPRAGDQLLVISLPDKTNQAGENVINNYMMVSSDEHIFQGVRDTISKHARYLRNSDEFLAADLDKNGDLIFCGYVVKYLLMAGKPERFDSDAIILSKLLLNERIPDGWGSIRMTLNRMLFNTYLPLSEGTRNTVMANLVAAGSGDNLALAKQSIALLESLSDSKQTDLRPFLDATRATAISRNYHTLLSTGKMEGNHQRFESQLSW